MADEPQKLSQQPIDVIIDRQYAGGVEIQKIMGRFDWAIFLSHLPFSPAPDIHDRAAMLKKANELIDEPVAPGEKPSILGTFYRVLDEAGVLDDSMLKASDKMVRAGFSAFLDIADTDHNGIITPDELKAFVRRDKDALKKEVSSRVK